MKHDPDVLDEHRGMAAQKATEIRRQLAEVEAQQTALQQRQAELEKFLLAAPSATWDEVAEKARYLISLLADTPEGRDPRRQEDYRRRARGLRAAGGGAQSSGFGRLRLRDRRSSRP